MNHVVSKDPLGYINRALRSSWQPGHPSGYDTTGQRRHRESRITPGPIPTGAGGGRFAQVQARGLIAVDRLAEISSTTTSPTTSGLFEQSSNKRVGGSGADVFKGGNPCHL
ncbi:hypothetical protein MGAST_13590 [Mycobacterium gastri 'Wayne']|uniref:Uncharacterized protein n=1 Tax=Mycobacterium gastri TaxID=1777 RepID=A0A1X1UU40_MYCGS|nr:hypothetical protein MGAST_13590 [Mycobacterium gastri 'Wayne']ORV60355.1 hypothetical protein AWC07_18250 [Mycobacterium gastri]